MASILGFTVTSWPKGILVHSQQRIGLVDAMPGFDDDGLAAAGWHRPPQDVQTITVVTGSIDTADALCQVYHQLHSQVGPIIDQFGRTFNDATVMSVMAVPRQILSTQFWVTTDWLIKLPAVRPS